MTGDHWRRRAACLGSDANFFPERGESQERARKICSHCPVDEECLEDALATDLPGAEYGIRGGLAASERRELARARRAGAAA